MALFNFGLICVFCELRNWIITFASSYTCLCFTLFPFTISTFLFSNPSFSLPFPPSLSFLPFSSGRHFRASVRSRSTVHHFEAFESRGSFARAESSRRYGGEKGQSRRLSSQAPESPLRSHSSAKGDQQMPGIQIRRRGDQSRPGRRVSGLRREKEENGKFRLVFDRFLAWS